MKRMLFHAMTLLSVLLMVIVLVAWPLSHWREDRLAWGWSHRYCSLASRTGILSLTWQTASPLATPSEPSTTYRCGPFALGTNCRILFWPSYHHAIDQGYEFIGHSSPGTFLQIPDWFLALLFSLWPVFWLRRRHRTFRRMAPSGFPLDPSQDDPPSK
jgi:hypothetical protein